MRYKNWHITKEKNTALMRVTAQVLPLVMKHKLFKIEVVNLLLVFYFKCLQRICIALHKLFGPLIPGRATMDFTQGLEERKIFQPIGVGSRKLFVGLLVLSVILR